MRCEESIKRIFLWVQDFLSACRRDILTKGGVRTLLNVLTRTPSEDAPIADVVNNLLSSLAEASDELTHQVTVQRVATGSGTSVNISG